MTNSNFEVRKNEGNLYYVVNCETGSVVYRDTRGHFVTEKEARSVILGEKAVSKDAGGPINFQSTLQLANKIDKQERCTSRRGARLEQVKKSSLKDSSRKNINRESALSEIKRLIQSSNLDDNQIVVEIKSKYPNANYNQSYVRYQRRVLKVG